MVDAGNILVVRGLQKRFGGVAALDGASVSVRRGEIAAVIGPNGSGKTTLFNVISGVTAPDAGSVIMEGREIRALPAWDIFRLGIARTFQTARLASGQSVLDNILMGRYLQTHSGWMDAFFRRKRLKQKEAAAIEVAVDVLSRVAPHLAKNPTRSVETLSYADRRRVEIVRALVSKPRLLLLDEPAAGMNNRETDALGQDILRINHEGLSILLIEHKVGFISRIAKHITVMSFGRNMAQGVGEDVLKRPEVIETYLGRRGV